MLQRRPAGWGCGEGGTRPRPLLSRVGGCKTAAPQKRLSDRTQAEAEAEAEAQVSVPRSHPQESTLGFGIREETR